MAGPRDVALNAISRDLAAAQRLLDRLARDQPRNLDIVSLGETLKLLAVDLSVMRLLISIGRPSKPRPKNVHRPVHHAGRKHKDWARIKRAQRLRYRFEAAAHAAARLRVDPSTLPRLTLP